jgi:hypothetical protein
MFQQWSNSNEPECDNTQVKYSELPELLWSTKTTKNILSTVTTIYELLLHLPMLFYDQIFNMWIYYLILQ